jgi:hypothetical protein
MPPPTRPSICTAMAPDAAPSGPSLLNFRPDSSIAAVSAATFHVGIDSEPSRATFFPFPAACFTSSRSVGRAAA